MRDTDALFYNEIHLFFIIPFPKKEKLGWDCWFFGIRAAAKLKLWPFDVEQGPCETSRKLILAAHSIPDFYLLVNTTRFIIYSIKRNMTRVEQLISATQSAEVPDRACRPPKPPQTSILLVTTRDETHPPKTSAPIASHASNRIQTQPQHTQLDPARSRITACCADQATTLLCASMECLISKFKILWHSPYKKWRIHKKRFH